MESKFQTIILKIVRHNELDHLRLILETLSEELDQSDSGPTGRRTPNQINPVILKRITTIRDRKSRNLLLIVAKYGHWDILNYLLNLGFPVDDLDPDGNNVVHLILNHVIKSNKHNKKKKSKKKSRHKDGDKSKSSIGYVQCCKLIEQILGRTNRPLLSTPNNRGLKATDLLETLWSQSSEEDRRTGDQILTRCVTQASARTSYAESSKSADKFQSSSEFFDEAESFDDSFESSYGNSWEDYFSGFQDQGFKSHLDAIREEYQRRKTSTFTSSAPKPSTSQARPESTHHFDDERTRREFYKRHAEALAKKSGQPSIKNRTTFETYAKLWSEFVEQESKPIKSLEDVAWPPFFDRNPSEQDQTNAITRLLNFVHHSRSKLRQLQIQWHPDRFMSRFGSRFVDEEIKSRVSGHVVSISQLLNAAVDMLRECQQDNIENS